jgi:phosphopantothenoylcysteine decarboxylase/phosphopantothenate--cysteine ligase
MTAKILLGITGSIAAYKAPYLVRELKEKSYEVRVAMTASSKEFVTPLTLQAVSDHAVYEELLDPVTESTMGHIRLARWADHILIAPASANFIAKLASGTADDLLSAICLAASVPIFIAPAMNQQMWQNAATQENITIIKRRGIHCLGPAIGLQACGEEGPGRMLEPADIVAQYEALTLDRSLAGKRILITAGPTHEAIDPVRFIANRSSGKMGYALASEAASMGAIVTLISGPVSLESPTGVKTAADMLIAVQKEIAEQNVFISAAAVADYQIAEPSSQKIKHDKKPLILNLTATTDILATVCGMNPKPFVIGFAAETEHLLENAEKKRLQKGVDLMVANDVSRADIGFESDDNAVTVFSDKRQIPLEKASKKIIAKQLLKILVEQSSKTLNTVRKNLK